MLLLLPAIPSISTNPDHKGDVRSAAGWLTGRLEHMGMEVRGILQ